MSKFEDYNQSCRVYDDQRNAVGTDVMAAMIQFYCGKTLQKLHVLDAGCGTGNYAKALIEMGARSMTLLDASSGMLEKAKSKLAGFTESGIIKEIVEAKLPAIPFPDDTFDAVMFNLVLNHLDREDPTFPRSVNTLKESIRILRPNGLIIISTVLSTTLSRVVWFSQLNMEFTNRYNAAVLPSLEQFEQMFQDAGLKCIQRLNILGSEMCKGYNNLDYPLEERSRAYWTFAQKEEVDEAIQKIESLKANGEYEKWVKEHDNADTSGILTIFFCKPDQEKQI